ncbi:MAG: DUF4350 domain-containing protein, partial [Candidatus Hodarchaeota archaeon]
VITVGSSAGAAGIVAFSSRGPVERINVEPSGIYAKPDVVAPGYGVVSGKAEDASIYDYPSYNSSDYGNLYTQWAGTSASAPEVAGLVALLLHKYPTLDPLSVKAALMLGAIDLDADPMEQGWGLINAVEACDVIDTANGAMTLATPKSYPTLPGGSNVLIIGDDRPDQNITIISTEALGSVEILSTGNASEYVTVFDNSVSVQEGYTHIGVGLDIPEDLPLSAVGYYEGELIFVQGTENITSVDLEFTITSYGGTLQVDMSHHSIDDPDDPSAYRYFREYLREQGVVMTEFGSPTSGVVERIDSRGLAAGEVFVIMDTESEYLDYEIDALHDFVEDGGTLLVFSEFYDTLTDSPAFAFESYNQILAPYGIQCEAFSIGEGPTPTTGLVYGVDHGGAVEDDELMDGVSNLYVLMGSTLSIDPSVAGAEGLFWYDDTRTHAIVAVAEQGKGRVIAISDGSTLYDDILYNAINSES